MSTFTCIVIGNGSLVIQCADMLLARGHAIAALVSGNPEVRAWAEARGLRVEDPGADLADRLGPLTVDWLFSIANLAIVPDAVLAKATRGAINFHDGPLPRYAGLNAPVWALINRETRHGVTWHLIEGGIDEGDIVEQRLFDLDDGETALTLNTKCYGAAIDSFGALVAALETGGPAPRAAGARPAHLLRPLGPAGRGRPARLRPGAGGAGRPGPGARLRPLLEPPRPAEDRRRRPAAAGRGSHGRLQSGAKRRPAPCSRWPTTASWSPPAPAPSRSAGSPTWRAIRCPRPRSRSRGRSCRRSPPRPRRRSPRRWPGSRPPRRTGAAASRTLAPARLPQAAPAAGPADLVRIPLELPAGLAGDRLLAGVARLGRAHGRRAGARPRLHRRRHRRRRSRLRRRLGAGPLRPGGGDLRRRRADLRDRARPGAAPREPSPSTSSPATRRSPPRPPPTSRSRSRRTRSPAPASPSRSTTPAAPP